MQRFEREGGYLKSSKTIHDFLVQYAAGIAVVGTVSLLGVVAVWAAVGWKAVRFALVWLGWLIVAPVDVPFGLVAVMAFAIGWRALRWRREHIAASSLPAAAPSVPLPVYRAPPEEPVPSPLGERVLKAVAAGGNLAISLPLLQDRVRETKLRLDATLTELKDDGLIRIAAASFAAMTPPIVHLTDKGKRFVLARNWDRPS